MTPPSPRPVVGGRSLDDPERARAYVAAAQRDLNVHLRRLGSPALLAVDGEWDDHTQLAFERVCRILGIAAERTVRTFRLIGAAAAERTDAEIKRAATDGAAFERELRALLRAGDQDATLPRRPRTVVGGSSLPAQARSRAYIAAVQRDLNRHLIALGSPAVLAVDGQWGEHTERAFKRVCRVLGIEAKRSVRAFRVIAGAAAPRSEAELERATSDGAQYAGKLRHHFAHAPARKPVAKPAAASSLEATLRRAGVRWPDIVARECERHGLPASLVCAVIEVESGFQNVFGHDAVRNPVKSPPGGLKAVTEAEYKRYLQFRAQGLGNQGVGPMQLTSPGLQDRADALGGCWRVGPNIRVGCEYLAGNIQRLGLRQGVIAYNGAAAYADKVFPAQQRWRARLGGDGVADGGGGTAGGGSGPRTFRLRKPRMRGNDVAALQKLVNRRFAELKVDVRIAVDAEFGPETRKAARRVAHALGLGGLDRGITPAHRVKMRRPSRRTQAELARAAARAGWLRRLRVASAAGGDYPLGARGQLIGTPHAGTHTRGNWQSDNAVDLRVPEGTAVIALADGVIAKTFHSPAGVTAGWQVTLRAARNAWFYGHLKTISVRAGERVRKGQVIGTSGSANGVPHLHLGQQLGTPRFQ